MEKLKLPSYGGQAVIEGVMMRGKQGVAIAMRAPDQSIVIHKEPLSNLYRGQWVRIPFVRGLVMLWDALVLGTHALTLSANTQTGEEEHISGFAWVVTILIALALGVGLFMLLPATIGQLIERWLGGGYQAAWIGNLMEGVLRLGILIGYIWLIGRMADIKRVFAYHGAEHKTINAFEAGAELTPQSVNQFSVEHPRCGTAFLLTLVVLSVLFFSLLGPLPIEVRLASRILLIPVLAGVAYEYIRWTSNHLDSHFVQVLVKPNLALQHLTTREPSLEMLEISIAAFNAMRAGESEIAL
jgi:uncharacterized protein YqhQ